jgi:phospholipid-transporting ATPase
MENNKVIVQFGETNPRIHDNKRFPNNKIVTTKYNIITLVPKSLLMQFKRVNNIYFLLVSVLTCLWFSPKEPISMIGTFAFVLIATMIKEAIEDYNRYKQDRASNNRDVWVLKHGNWSQVKCWTLIPGDIIKVVKDEEFSADTVVLQSRNETGYCYIDTKNLDGETNLKEKASIEQFKGIEEGGLSHIHGYIDCEAPNENLTSWKGVVNFEDRDFVADLRNIILKGCILKNTEYIVGVVVYSGKNTKIMKNSKAPRQKVSKLLIVMNKLLYSVFIFDLLICAIFGYLNLKWDNNYSAKYTYIYTNNSSNSSEVSKFFTNFLTFFVAYSHIIPISLYVALEVVKIVQGFLIYFDDDIFDFTIDKPAACRATDLIEELGQVEFIFSDKTGTLTQNSMVLKKIYINGKVYGNNQDEDPNKQFTINGDIGINRKLKSEDKDDVVDKKMINDFLYLLSLCHAVFPEANKEGKIIYQGASPDDIALVKGAQQVGIEFIDKNFTKLDLKNHITGKVKKYDIITEMPFDSDRKRMSVVAQDLETGEYLLLSKGADTTMLNRMEFDKKELEEAIRVIKVLSKEGLRVLCLGQRKINQNEYTAWAKRFEEARLNGEDLTCFYDELECSLEFLGCTAIEDKLQEGVAETIYTLLTCNIRVWVLTGDKQDTAEEIAKSCKLINDNMFILYLVDEGDRTAEEKLQDIINTYHIHVDKDAEIDLEGVFRKIRKKEGKDMSIIVDGITLGSILDREDLSLQFFHIAIAAKSVICCRVSPKQKSKVVQLAKKYGKWITLSIGDGANDVPMIMEAHIGVGIQGKEGTQAVRSADFSIGQFRFLEKLLLNYGRIGYIKISKFICFYFYKNIILVFTDLFFAVSNGFSGQIFFADYLSTMYNALLTSWPCLFTFSFEKDVDLIIVKKFPVLYLAGQKNYFFNMRVFWSYILYAIFHGFICYYVPVQGMKYFNDSTGITMNHWFKSTTSFSMIIHIVTLKLLVISDFWNVVSLVATFGSIAFYYLVIVVLNTDGMAFILQNELAGLLFNIVRYPKFWITIIVASMAALLPDIAIKQFLYTFKPNPTDYIKHHLQDPVLRSIVFNDEKQCEIFNSKKAKRAEKFIQEVLLRARHNKKIDQSEFSMKADSDLMLSARLSNKSNLLGNTNLPISEDGSNYDGERKFSRVSDNYSNIRGMVHEMGEEQVNHMKSLLKTNTFAKKISAAESPKPKYGYIHTPISSSEDDPSRKHEYTNESNSGTYMLHHEPASLFSPHEGLKLDPTHKHNPISVRNSAYSFQNAIDRAENKLSDRSQTSELVNKNQSHREEPGKTSTNKIDNIVSERSSTSEIAFKPKSKKNVTEKSIETITNFQGVNISPIVNYEKFGSNNIMIEKKLSNNYFDIDMVDGQALNIISKLSKNSENPMTHKHSKVPDNDNSINYMNTSNITKNITPEIDNISIENLDENIREKETKKLGDISNFRNESSKEYIDKVDEIEDYANFVKKIEENK